MTASATNKVLSLAELLEQILFNLPQRDLLLAQRVSGRWRNIIENSPPLQKKLFFQPSRICPLPRGDENEHVEINPLVDELFPMFTAINVLNPWFNCMDDDFDYQSTGVCAIRNQGWYQCETRRKAFLRPEASWRRMFVSDPPPRLAPSMRIRLEGCCGCNRDELDGELGVRYRGLNDSPGARLGLIWDVVVFILDDLPDGDFFLEWERTTTEELDGRVKMWTLQIVIDTEHAWECYRAEEAYKLSGLQVVKYEDLVEYGKYQAFEGDVTQEEAVPLSFLRKYKAKNDDSIALARVEDEPGAGGQSTS
ncbi:hypothetical protein BJX61DRAFT_508003 [Aspergillus egyptiacus]|nr:hypothetical protein BJX61DRAFT_508003 [Aspergillus egyptiacus]